MDFQWQVLEHGAGDKVPMGLEDFEAFLQKRSQALELLGASQSH